MFRIDMAALPPNPVLTLLFTGSFIQTCQEHVLSKFWMFKYFENEQR